MTKVQGALAALGAAAALAACGAPGPARPGTEAAAPPGKAAARVAERFALLTAPSVCPPTCNAAEGRARFGELQGTDGFSFRVVDSTAGDSGEVSLNFEDDAYTTEGTPVTVVITATSVQVSGSLHGPLGASFGTFTFTLDTASGGLKSLEIRGGTFTPFNEFVQLYPGYCEVPSS